jgi:hypothetical protein
VAAPWKLTDGCRPSASARFPLAVKVVSPYAAVASTFITILKYILAMNQFELHNSEAKENV